MSDVADMLGIANQPRQQLSAGEEASKLLLDKPKVAAQDKKKKPKGMKREVFDLIAKDGIASSVQTNSMNPVFKSKRTLATEGKWLWAPIESSARTDNLKSMRHWVRADKFYPDYPYAQFNVKMDKITFSDEQYNELLDKPGWTKEDTLALIDTCHEYDLRWPVIADRIVLSKEKRSEELQARYYFVYNTIQQANANANAPSFGNPITVKTYNYDLEKEAFRRKKQDLMYYRTKEDEKEEVKLREELKSINEQLKKLKKTMKTAARESAASANIPVIKAEAAVNLSSNAVDTIKIGQYLAEGKMILDSSLSNPIDRSAATNNNANNNSSTDFSAPSLLNIVQIRETAPQPGKPALQSARLYLSGSHPIGKTIFQKMNAYLRELNIPEHPMPTKRVCDLVDTIRRDAQVLMTLQNQLKKKDKEVTQAKSSGIFKNTAGNGRTSSEQAMTAVKAIAVKAEKASKPKAAPKPRQQKKDAAGTASNATNSNTAIANATDVSADLVASNSLDPNSLSENVTSIMAVKLEPGVIPPTKAINDTSVNNDTIMDIDKQEGDPTVCGATASSRKRARK